LTQLYNNEEQRVVGDSVAQHTCSQTTANIIEKRHNNLHQYIW